MAKRFQITLAQLNPTVGDLEGNYKAALGAEIGETKAAAIARSLNPLSERLSIEAAAAG